MTNLTLKEKQALEEVFLCFQKETTWHEDKLYYKKMFKYKVLKFYAKNKRFCRKCFLAKRGF